MKAGKVERYLNEKKDSEGCLFFALIDPLDYDSLEMAANSAKEAYEGGADLLVVGGSTGVQGHTLDETVSRIKEVVDVPVNLFPGNIGTVTNEADSIYFMSMLNSRNPYWITGAQTLAAPVVRALGIEPLPVAYMVVGPGGTVAWVGDTNTIPLNKPKLAAAMALSAEMMGFRFIFTDAGSAAPEPVPPKMVTAVKKTISPETFYIDAGGIRTKEQVRSAASAGADAIQMGTVLEKSENIKEKVSSFVKVVKEEGKKRI